MLSKILMCSLAEKKEVNTYDIISIHVANFINLRNDLTFFINKENIVLFILGYIEFTVHQIYIKQSFQK